MPITVNSEGIAADTSSIAAQRPANKGLDYAWLKRKGTRIVQALSSDIWTDYNEHDPGVTTLEQLCYALTELSYRAELPFADLFAQPGTGDIQPRSHGMFIARRIFPCNSVTVNDYRKLIVDRVSPVRNVWLKPRIPPEGSTEVNGLYDIWLYAPEADDCAGDCSFTPNQIREKVRQVYSRYRNLCEDLHGVRLLSPLRTVVFADVVMGERQSAERLLAAICFALGKLLAPELEREPLNALLTAGEAPDEIFNGPLLLHGFIPDAQLQPKATTLAVNEIIRVIAQTQGVGGVSNVLVRTEIGSDAKVWRASSSIPVPVDKYLHLDTQPRPEGRGFSIRLYRAGNLCQPKAAAVERELKLLWMNYRRGYPLEAQYEEYFGVPSGQWHNLSRYYSVQNQYPGVYGIGSFGLPPDATVERRAQAKQLKAYLLPFEQLMTNYFAQLAHVPDLFSIAPENWRTYYWQSLAKSVPDVQPVLAPDYAEGLNRIVTAEDSVVERRSRFLAFLLSLYANNLHAERSGGESISPLGNCGFDPEAPENLLRARLAFLRLLVSSTRSRGRAFDYLAPLSARSFAGMEIKIRVEMGLDLEDHQPLNEALGKSRTVIARGTADATTGQAEGRDSAYMEEHFLPVLAHPRPAGVPRVSSVLKGSSVTEEFISAARHLENLFVGNLPGEQTVVLACRMPAGTWIVIDLQPGIEGAVEEAYALNLHLNSVHHALTQLYIVEHTLLRFGRHPKRKTDHFCYSFTLTAVVCLPSDRRLNRDNRTTVEEIVRENTPADTVAKVCFLDPWSMLRFEILNRAWRSALHNGRKLPIALTSARLRLFLQRHRHTTFPSSE